VNLPESALLLQLEQSRKAYQAALIDLRLAEDAARELRNTDGGYALRTARRQLSAATRDFQDALRIFSEFALGEAGKGAQQSGTS
jgi:hypothetical protein